MYLEIAEKIKKIGGTTYIVGGAIRDFYDKGTPIEKANNIDLEVMGLNSEEFEKILEGFGRWKLVGKKYKVYLIKNLEIKLSNYDSVEESINERDLAVNSLYYNVITKKIIDLNGGLEDIKNKILKYSNKERFLEDPLRVLRTIELGARLGYKLDKGLEEIIKNNFYRIEEIPKERIMLELEKILMNHKKPSEAFKLLDGVGGVEILFPELVEGKNTIQDKIYHPEGDVYTHTLMTLDILSLEERTLDIMLALLFHDIGKNITKENNFKGHTKKSQKLFNENIKQLTNNKQIIKSTSNLILYHATPLILMLNDKVNKNIIRKFMLNTDIPKLLKVYKADLLGRGKLDNDWELENINKIFTIYNEEKNNIERIITGNHLTKWGYKNFSNYGKLLKKLHILQLEDKFKSVEEGKVYFKNEIKGN